MAGLQQTGRGKEDALSSAGLLAFGGLGEQGGRGRERSDIGHPVYYRFQYGGLRADLGFWTVLPRLQTGKSHFSSLFLGTAETICSFLAPVTRNSCVARITMIPISLPAAYYLPICLLSPPSSLVLK